MTDQEELPTQCDRCKGPLPPPDVMGGDGSYVFVNSRTAPSHGMHLYFCPACAHDFVWWLRLRPPEEHH